MYLLIVQLETFHVPLVNLVLAETMERAQLQELLAHALL